MQGVVGGKWPCQGMNRVGFDLQAEISARAA